MRPVEKAVVLGLGNLLLRDDGIGVWLVRKLKKIGPPPGVTCLEGGTGLWAVTGLLSQNTRLLVVDALRNGGKPGSAYLLSETDFDPGELAGESWNSLHDLRLLGLLQLPELAGRLQSWSIMGVEPQEIGPGVGLTPALEAKLPGLTEILRQEAGRLGIGS